MCRNLNTESMVLGSTAQRAVLCHVGSSLVNESVLTLKALFALLPWDDAARRLRSGIFKFGHPSSYSYKEDISVSYKLPSMGIIIMTWDPDALI